MRKILFITFVLFIAVFAFQDLNPFSDEMILFHDKTQPARVDEFASSIAAGHIPPRISPEFSFGMGYPVFNFYAPTSYWITSVPVLAGMNAASAIQLSLGLAILASFGAMYVFLKEWVDEYAALAGGAVYAVSPYIAVETFVRGNLGEMWLFVFFPLTLYALEKLVATQKHTWFAAFAFSFSLMLTSHNALSLIAAGFVGTYVLFKPHIWKSVAGLVAGVGLSMYFVLPAAAGLSSTYAQESALLSKFSDHFLCYWQVWDSQWGFGGSNPGCADGMSFKLGKLAVVLGILGMLYLLFEVVQSSFKKYTEHLLIAVLTLTAYFLTLPFSEPLWFALGDTLSLFQFPWRFLMFVLFGLAFFTAYVIHGLCKRVSTKLCMVGAVFFIFLQVYSSGQYFEGQTTGLNEYQEEFVSESYKKNLLVYGIPEYVPKTVDVEYYFETGQNPDNVRNDRILQTENPDNVQDIENTGFYRKAETTADEFAVNVHYQSYWQIKVNGEKVEPDEFDKLGRPLITSDTENTTVEVQYRQTPLQHASNGISLLIAAGLVIPFIKKRIQHHEK